jgi:hypothetical protein
LKGVSGLGAQEKGALCLFLIAKKKKLATILSKKGSDAEGFLTDFFSECCIKNTKKEEERGGWERLRGLCSPLPNQKPLLKDNGLGPSLEKTRRGTRDRFVLLGMGVL